MPYRKMGWVDPEIKCQNGRQAYIFWDRKKWPLGPWDGKSPHSREVLAKYLRTCSFLEERFHAKQAGAAEPDPEHDLTIAECIAAYLDHLERDEDGDRRPDGSLSSHYDRAITHLRPLLALHGPTAASKFTAHQLKALRKEMRKDTPTWWKAIPNYLDEHKKPKQWSISYTNTAVQNIIGMFSWAESEDFVTKGTTEHLRAVQPLRQTEHYEAPTVANEVVAATVAHLSPVVAAMVRLQRITAMRCGELCIMRPIDIDRRKEVWVYHPTKYKNKWRKLPRLIPLGPECQKILAPLMNRPSDAYLFTTRESREWWQAQREAKAGQDRKTPIYPCELKARRKKKRRTAKKAEKQPARPFNQHSYRQAIEQAIERARQNGHPDLPDWLPYAIRHSRITEVQEAMGWDDAQAVAGHESAQTTRRYAHDRHQRALRIAAGTQGGEGDDNVATKTA